MNRHKTRIASRLAALSLACALTLPNPAFALRGQQQEDPSQRAGLEEALKDPSKTLRQLTQRATPIPPEPAGLSLPDNRLRQPDAMRDAGLEEQGGINRRQVLKWGGVAAVVLGVGGGSWWMMRRREPAPKNGQPQNVPAPREPNRATWVFGYHGSPQDMDKLVRQLRLAKSRGRVVLGIERAPWFLDQVEAAYPQVTDHLTLEKMNELIRLLEEHGELWIQNEKNSALGARLSVIFTDSLSRFDLGAVVKALRKKPEQLKDEKLRRRLGAHLPIIEYLVEDSESSFFLEEPALLDFFKGLRWGLARRQALFDFALADEVGKYDVSGLIYYRSERALQAPRDRAFAKKTQGVLEQERKEAPDRVLSVVIQRGVDHRGTAQLVDHEAAGFRMEEAEAPRAYGFAQSLKEFEPDLSNGGVDNIPTRARWALRKDPIWQALVSVYQMEDEILTSERLYREATEAANTLSEEEILQLRRDLFRNREIFQKARTKPFGDFRTAFATYVVAWLNDHKKTASLSYLKPQYRALTVPDVERSLRKFLDLPPMDDNRKGAARLGWGDEMVIVRPVSRWEIEGIKLVGLEEPQATWTRLEEQWAGFRSHSTRDPMGWVLIGKEVARKFPGLPVFAGLEQHVVIARGDSMDTALYLAEQKDISSVHLFAGLEEAKRLTTALSSVHINTIVHSPRDFQLLLPEILFSLGIPREAASAGLEEFYRQLQEFGEAA